MSCIHTPCYNIVPLVLRRSDVEIDISLSSGAGASATVKINVSQQSVSD